MNDLTNEWLDGVQERNARAWAEIAGLCNGTRKWTMRVPVDSERDSDEVIAAALKDGEKAVGAIRRVVELLAEAETDSAPAYAPMWVGDVWRAIHGVEHGAPRRADEIARPDNAEEAS